MKPKTIKLRGFDVTRAQRGWVCDCTFTVLSVRQCSREECVSRGSSGWRSIVGAFFAIVDAWHNAKLFARAAEAKPGERAALGWIDLV